MQFISKCKITFLRSQRTISMERRRNHNMKVVSKMNRWYIKCCLNKTIIISALHGWYRLARHGDLVAKKPIKHQAPYIYIHYNNLVGFLLILFSSLFLVNQNHLYAQCKDKTFYRLKIKYVIHIERNAFLKYIGNELSFPFRKLTFEQFQTAIKIP